MRGVRIALVASLAMSSGLRAAQSRVSLDEVLRSAGAYLAAYDRSISAVVAEEDYLQVARGTTAGLSARRLRSDFLVLNLLGTWVGFRDVFEVDGQPVRDRQERLAALFVKSASDALSQAQQIAGESARFNLSQSIVVGRTINVPMTALRFLHAEEQWRSAFRLDGSEKIGGTDCAIVRFTERATPRLLATDDGSNASGAFWVDPASGRVQRSELKLNTARRIPRGSGVSATRDETLSVSATVRVNYADQPRLDLWLPVSMDEHYELTPRNTTIDGHATYSNFRKFEVETKTGIR